MTLDFRAIMSFAKLLLECSASNTYLKVNYYICVPGEQLGDMLCRKYKHVCNGGKGEKENQDPISGILVKILCSFNSQGVVQAIFCLKGVFGVSVFVE